MPRPRKYPIEEVLALYDTGISQCEVARRLGLHPTTVNYALRVSKTGRHPRLAVKQAQRDLQRAAGIAQRQGMVKEIVRLYVEERYSTPQIEDCVPLSRSAIRVVLLAAGISLRPRGIRVRRDVRIAPQKPFGAESVETVERLMQIACSSRKGCVA